MQVLSRVISTLVGLLLAWVMPVSSAGAEPAQYSIDPTHTFVSFEIDHFATSTNRGRFDKKQGSITFDSAAKTGKVQISVDVASVSTGTPQFDAFLQSFELFDAATYPTFTFVSDAFVFSGEQLAEVQGQLTLLGKTQPVVFKVKRFNCYRSLVFWREVCGGDLEATIDRTLWGINYGLIFGFPKAVRLLVQVEAIKL